MVKPKSISSVILLFALLSSCSHDKPVLNDTADSIAPPVKSHADSVMDEFKQTMLRAFKEPDLLGTNAYPTIRLTAFGKEINGKKTTLVFRIFRNSNKQPLLVFKTDTNALDSIVFDSTTFVLAETRFAFLQKTALSDSLWMNNNSGDLFFEPFWVLEYGGTYQKEYRLKTGTTRANPFLRQLADSLMMYVR